MVSSNGDGQQIVGRERSQLVSQRQLVRNVVVARRVNSTVRRLFVINGTFFLKRRVSHHARGFFQGIRTGSSFT